MTRAQIMQGLSAAMTLQNVTNRDLRYDSSSVLYSGEVRGNAPWAGPFTPPSSCFYPIDQTGSILNPSWDYPFVISVRVRLSQQTVSGDRVFVFGTDAPYSGGTTFAKNPGCTINSNRFSFGYSTDGVRWNYMLEMGGSRFPEDDMPISVDSVYTLKYEWTGEEFIATVKSGWKTVKRSAEVSQKPYHSQSYNLVFGNAFNVPTSERNVGYAVIDTAHTYIKVNGIPVWGAGY